MSTARKSFHLALTVAFFAGQVSASPSLIISSISDGDSPQWRKDLPVVQGKIRRWLPPAKKNRWEVKAVEADTEEKKQFLLRGVGHSLDRWEEAYATGPAPGHRKAMRELGPLRADIGKLARDGLSMARYHRLLALAANGEANQALVKEHLEKALAYVPGEALEAFSHRFEPLANTTLAMGHRLSRCRYEIAVDPESAAVTVNGFALGKVREVRLPTGEHEIEVKAPLFARQRTVARCDRPGTSRLAFTLPLEDRPSEVSLTEPEVRLWVKEEGKKIRLFLETPGVAFDEVTRSKPIATADLVRNPTFESDAPISQFQELLGLHLAAAEMKRERGQQTVIEKGEIPAPSAWYQDWRFWTVAGVVASGVALSLFVGDRSRVDTTH